MSLPNIIILGDSHSYDLKRLKGHNKSKENFNLLKTISVAGKTAQGLSKKNNHNIYIEKIKNIKEEIDYLGIFLGEVDCAYTIYSRTKIHKTTKAQEVFFAIDQLILFALNLKSIGFDNIFFMGPIIPLVENYNTKDIPEIIKKRRLVNVSHKERTKLTLWFNRRLKKKAEEAGFKYITINDKLLNKITKVVKKRYQNKHSLHHLRPKYALDLWSNEIIKLINED